MGIESVVFLHQSIFSTLLFKKVFGVTASISTVISWVLGFLLQQTSILHVLIPSIASVIASFVAAGVAVWLFNKKNRREDSLKIFESSDRVAELSVEERKNYVEASMEYRALIESIYKNTLTELEKKVSVLESRNGALESQNEILRQRLSVWEQPPV